MKKLIALLLALAMCVPMAFAVGPQGGSNNSGSGLNNSDIVDAGNDQGIQSNAISPAQVMAQNMTQLREMTQQRTQLMAQETQSMTQAQQNVYQNQNQVRLAVHTMLSMENMVGGIGQNVSAIARQFNNSVQATIHAEEKIQTRSQITRFFVGGDKAAATEIEQQVEQNQLRIQQLNQLKTQCQCSEEVKAMFQEQIQSMDQEQTRLHQVAQAETQSNGIFGWLFK